MRIVIADDEPIIVMNLKEILEGDGHEVVGTAGNGFATIDVCKKTKPDVLIVDIRMPDLDGLSATKYIHEEGLADTIIVESAFDDADLVDKAAENGVSAFLVKPIDSKTLLSTLKVAASRSAERAALKSEVEAVNQNMESRKKVERAKGILMDRDGISEQEAFDRLRKISKENNISMELVAEIIIGDD